MYMDELTSSKNVSHPYSNFSSWSEDEDEAGILNSAAVGDDATGGGGGGGGGSTCMTVRPAAPGTRSRLVTRMDWGR